MSARLIGLLPLALLASCGSPEGGATHNNAAAVAAGNDAQPQVNQAAAVAALAPGQREGVLFRAIQNAGLNCQKIVKVDALPASGDVAEWRVKCDDGAMHLVAIPPQGDATVTSRTDTQPSL